ncbi:hypothetical protein OsJ_32062 [Oryza sativa Japonica Group]|uniref:Uncharacterized protein n=1 Tax=Oryza sativa subsp. japonica TaxID=39947 RepID=B9G6H7_ORYSJ|nr:hypothetical protein OsJ_32062 [Oryza sativa Japonica Group]
MRVEDIHALNMSREVWLRNKWPCPNQAIVPIARRYGTNIARAHDQSMWSSGKDVAH